MQETKHIQIKDYDYELPDGRIAKYPLPERDASKLLVYDRGNIRTERFTALPGLLPEGTLMVFNNTKVVQARLHFRKETGAQIEVFCLEPVAPNDYALMFSQEHRCGWLCLVGNLKKWKTGELRRTVTVGGQTVTLRAVRGADAGTSHRIDFEWDGDGVTWADILEAVGELPIPPYLNRPTEERDKQTYQTVYSKVKGSVAAPTAGLHFTDRVLEELDTRGVEREEVTLHVGAGTFKPVKSDEIEGHEMHTEYISVCRRTIERLLAHGCGCVAVGTTSVRTLESLYYIGVTLHGRPDAPEEALHVSQWMPYEYAEQTRPAGSVDDGRPEALTTEEALGEILAYLERNGLEALHTSTQIIIAPGYEFHVVRAMVTNFHQPQSTLLLLVSAFVHGDWRSIYRYALDSGYRFLSYGDSSLLIP
ncbi:MAG: S-adenosylmethionine:tRNA ribosyltransferase-isomerase [Paraprevotella sp.]|nr:S-adenosylmethionine:tRNA ribosyltransferase-isomerase [Paraprevotella sp.]